MTTASVPILAADERVGVVLTDPAPGAALDSARRFMLFGHVVVIGARRMADAEQAARMLRRGGGAVFGAPLELTDLSSVNAFAATAAYLAGPVDVLIVGGAVAPAISGGHEGSLGIQHLAAQLLSVTPRRRHADLMVVSYGRNPAADPPRVCSSSRFTAALGEWAAIQESELHAGKSRETDTSDPCSGSTELQSLLDEWQYALTMPDSVRTLLRNRITHHQTHSFPDDFATKQATSRSAAGTATRR